MSFGPMVIILMQNLVPPPPYLLVLDAVSLNVWIVDISTLYFEILTIQTFEKVQLFFLENIFWILNSEI